MMKETSVLWKGYFAFLFLSIAFRVAELILGWEVETLVLTVL